MPDDQVLEAEEDETAKALEALHGGPGSEVGSTEPPAGTEGGAVGSGGGGGGGGGGVAVVVDSSGQVVGTAHFNPQTGVFEIDGTETTVVEEESGSQASATTGTPVEPAGGGIPGGGGGGGASPGSGFIPHGVIPPQAFRFTRHPTANEQRSQCVPIIFRASTPFGPVEISVGVVVTAPVILRPGTAQARELTEREAQLDSSAAATSAAEIFATALNAGALNSTQVQAQFPRQMDEIMRSHGIGYRVQRCNASID
jgi:hypothetical protein